LLFVAPKTIRVPPPEGEIRSKRPPHDVFGIDPFAVRDSLRFRIWPETEVGLTLAGKKPRAGMEPVLEDLTCVPTRASSGLLARGTPGFSPARTPSRPPGRWLTRCSATSPPFIPTPG